MNDITFCPEYVDIADALDHLRRGFEKYDINPTTVELGNARDGERLKRVLRDADQFSLVLERHTPKGPFNQVTICGVIVRWPANYV